MSEMREAFEKRMAGIFDLSAYVDSQGDIRYSDSHTQAAWDGCQLGLRRRKRRNRHRPRRLRCRRRSHVPAAAARR